MNSRILLIYLASIFSIPADVASSQTPSQHQKILDSVDLSERDPELNERIIWEQNELIPNCKENFQPAGCYRTTHQFIQWPFPRSKNVYKTDISFLSNGLANRLAFATHVSQYSNVHEYCTDNAISSLNDWKKSSERANLEEYIYITYLSSNDPWFFCFHRDNSRIVTDLEASPQFELESREFWIWHNGVVVGEVQCGTLYSSRSDRKKFPQCTFYLSFANGDARMSIGPFPAASLRRALLSLTPMTQNFWKRTELDTMTYGIEEGLFYHPPVFDIDAESMILTIEAETR